MPTYNLLEYRKSYSMTSGSLYNYYRDEIDDADNNASDFKWFEYKKNSRKNTINSSTTCKGTRCRSTTTTKSANFKC